MSESKVVSGTAATKSGQSRKSNGTSRQSRQELWERLRRSDAALRRALEKMNTFRDLAYSDPLTGLYNRRYFEERMEQEISRLRRRPDNHFSVLVIDVNGFKGINDTFGHLAGDELLKNVATYLEEHLRGHDVCCRTGGDEFMVILPDTDGNEFAPVVARLRAGLGKINGNANKQIGLSIGAVTWPDHGATGNDLIAAADAAMYQDKQRQKAMRAGNETMPNRETRSERQLDVA